MLTPHTLRLLTSAVVVLAGVLLAAIFVAGYLVLIQYEQEDGVTVVVEEVPATTTESVPVSTGIPESERYQVLSAPLNPVVDAAAVGATSSMEFAERQALLEAVVEEEAGTGEMLSDEERLRLLTAPVDESYE